MVATVIVTVTGSDLAAFVERACNIIIKVWFEAAEAEPWDVPSRINGTRVAG